VGTGRKQWIGKECGGKGKTALSTDIKRRGGIGSEKKLKNHWDSKLWAGVESCGQG